MFDAIRRRFAAPATLPTADTAWSETEAFSGANFPKYDPEALRNWKGYKIYRDMMQDEQVKAVVRFRRDSITGREWYFNIDPDHIEQLGEDEAMRRQALFYHVVKVMNGTFSSRLNGIMSALIHGFSLTEKVYQQIEWDGLTWIGIKHLRTKPYHTFEFFVDEYGNLEKIQQRTAGAYIDIEPERMINFVQNSDVDEQFGESELNAAYRSWYAKNIIIKLQSIYLERYAGGFLVAQPRMGSGKQVRRGSSEFAEVQALLKSLQTKTGVFIPEWMTLEHHQPGNTDAFEKAIAQHDKSIAKALLVPNLLGISEQGSTGSYSQSQTQLEAFLWMLEADAKRLAECLNEQLFHEIGDANFGDGLYPEFCFRELSQAMISQILGTWNMLAQSGAVERTDADEAYIRDLLGFPEKQIDDLIEDEPETEPEVEPEQENEPEPEPEPEIEIEAEDDDDQGSTIAGQMVSIESPAFTRALRRVDFAAIDNSSQAIQWEGEDRLSNATDELIEYAEEAIYTRSVAEDPAEAEGFKPRPSDVKAINKAFTKSINDGWNLGNQHARRELLKAGFNRKGAFANIRDIAQQFISARATSATSKLTGDILAMVDNVYLNSIKNGWSDAETARQLYTQAASMGVISKALADEKLGELLDPAKTPTHRLAASIRTTQFEAINESRKAFFEDPQLGGYVVAYEYSAILDGRTTDICTQLDEHTHPKDSQVWERFTPPNHYNCRSLLIPITQDDEWSETATPITVSPQAGFKAEPEKPKDPPAPVINITMPELHIPPAEVTFNPTIEMPNPEPQKFTEQPKAKARTISLDIGGKKVTGKIEDHD